MFAITRLLNAVGRLAGTVEELAGTLAEMNAGLRGRLQLGEPDQQPVIGNGAENGHGTGRRGKRQTT
jgi:hypothetical protein